MIIYKDLEKLVYQFTKYRIPVSIIMLGNNWHRQNPRMKSGLSFDEKLFKRPKRITDFLHSKNCIVEYILNGNNFHMEL